LEIVVFAEGGERKEFSADIPEAVPETNESQESPEAMKEGRNGPRRQKRRESPKT
jgi:hypothetical protein